MSTATSLKEIPLKDIHVSKNNPRKTFDDKSMTDLAISIKDHGILQPLLVRPKGKKYELVCGERRYRAAKMNKIEMIPVNIRELTDDEAFEMMIIENLERKDVHPLEEANAFQQMLDSGKYTLDAICDKMAKRIERTNKRIKDLKAKLIK